MLTCRKRKHNASGAKSKMIGIECVATPAQIAEFVKEIRPLDLLVFRGGETVSTVIRGLEKLETGCGDISHVEVAITREWCERIKPIAASTNVTDNEKTLFSWGSTMSGGLNDGVDNAETGQAKFGMQIRVLEDLVSEYLKTPGANIGLCKLIDNPTVHAAETDNEFSVRSAALKEKINSVYDQYNGRTYNANPFALLGALFPSMRGMRQQSEDILSKFTDCNKWLFCSEWVAVLYEATGVIIDSTDGVTDGKLINPANVAPVDFIGADSDGMGEGIVKPICSIPPIWVKK